MTPASGFLAASRPSPIILLSAMRYLCTHCDLRFETTDDKPRCTKCLRVSGVERLEANAAGALTKPRSPIWLIVGLVSALVELGAFLYGWLDPPAGAAGIALMVGWVAWAAVSAVLIVAGLRGALARMH